MTAVEPLTRAEQWQEIRTRPGRTLVFKHSSTCPISAAAHDRFLAWARALGTDHLPIYEVLVIEDRALARQIGADLGVEHQSPQAILLEDGRAVWHASHWAITGDRLDAALADPPAAPSHSTSLLRAQAEHKAGRAPTRAG